MISAKLSIINNDDGDADDGDADDGANDDNDYFLLKVDLGGYR